MKREAITRQLVLHPLTRERWADFERLFGERGACGGCWCMWWRLKRSEYEAQKGEGNKHAMHALVESGEIPGLLAYLEGQPIAWCSVGPRDSYPVLNRSRNLKRVDDLVVWSIVCCFITKPYRRRGVSKALLHSVLQYCREQGVSSVEGYPIDPKKPEYPDVFAGTGFLSAFQAVGFKEVARRSATRPIVRYDLAD